MSPLYFEFEREITVKTVLDCLEIIGSIHFITEPK
jgi:hypothetical protein